MGPSAYSGSNVTFGLAISHGLHSITHWEWSDIFNKEHFIKYTSSDMKSKTAAYYSFIV